MKAIEQLKPYFKKRRTLLHIGGLLGYDLQTLCPSLAMDQEGNLIDQVYGKVASISKDPTFIELVKKANQEELTPLQRALIDYLMKDIAFMEKISMEDYLAHMEAVSTCNRVWMKCRPLNDFATWLPYWKKAVTAAREEAELRKEECCKTRYDSCLNQYEPGNNQEIIYSVFNPLKEYLIPKVKEAIKKQKALEFIPIHSYEHDAQLKLGKAALELIGYDFARGAMMESVHPFSDSIGQFDARLTTKIVEKDFRSNLFSCLHEGGHCIQFQNLPKEDFEEYVGELATSAICETHSRLFENLIGRSKEFTPHLKKLCAQYLDKEFDSFDDETFYNSLNQISPTNLIRIEADELTYCLHIIIRYEIERDLINGDIECEDVPALWKKKYKDYLNVDVLDDKDGCMQDVHWSQGSYGYFPSYALGNLYGAMIIEKIKEELPYKQLLIEGDLKPIREWLTNNDFAYDYLKPDLWLKKVTGKKLDSSPFINYLESKF